MIGHIITGDDGNLSLDLDPCELCAKAHRQPILHVEQKTCIDGEPFPYWSSCPNTSSIILMRAAVGDSISVAILEPPMRGVLRKSK